MGFFCASLHGAQNSTQLDSTNGKEVSAGTQSDAFDWKLSPTEYEHNKKEIRMTKKILVLLATLTLVIAVGCAKTEVTTDTAGTDTGVVTDTSMTSGTTDMSTDTSMTMSTDTMSTDTMGTTGTDTSGTMTDTMGTSGTSTTSTTSGTTSTTTT